MGEITYQLKCRMVNRKKERMELVYLKERMWCIYIHHSSYLSGSAILMWFGQGSQQVKPIWALGLTWLDLA